LRIETYDTGGIYGVQAKAQVKRTKDDLQVTGPILALDLGEKLVGTAVSDERLITTKRLPPLNVRVGKKLLQDVRNLIERFDAQTIVVGLPLRMDGTEVMPPKRPPARLEPGQIHRAASLSSGRALDFLRSHGEFKVGGLKPDDIPAHVDGEAARDDPARLYRVRPETEFGNRFLHEALNTSDNRGGLACHRSFGAWTYRDLTEPVAHTKSGQYIEIPKGTSPSFDHQ
jgi:hypothetical protein